MIFLQPLLIDPLFHKFEPLATKDPALTAALEQMVQRAGQNIPPDRMYWMNASEKVNELNAYVTGIGGSKRIVVWDTTISKMTTPEIVSVAGHEMGHYVLNHIPKALSISALGLFWLFSISAIAASAGFSSAQARQHGESAGRTIWRFAARAASAAWDFFVRPHSASPTASAAISNIRPINTVSK